MQQLKHVNVLHVIYMFVTYNDFICIKPIFLKKKVSYLDPFTSNKVRKCVRPDANGDNRIDIQSSFSLSTSMSYPKRVKMYTCFSQFTLFFVAKPR